MIIVGDNPASRVYVRNKVRACEDAGFESRLIELPATTTEAELLARLAALNSDPAIHGILTLLSTTCVSSIARFVCTAGV